MPAANTAQTAARELKARLAAKNGDVRLRRVDVAELAIERRRNGRGFMYVRDGRRVADERLLHRFKRLAVPPAYEDVRYAESPTAHIQAIGRDSAGRIQYRYHPDWDKRREQRKARRLKELVRLLPKIRRALGRHLRDGVLPRLLGDDKIGGLVDLLDALAATFTGGVLAEYTVVELNPVIVGAAGPTIADALLTKE